MGRSRGDPRRTIHANLDRYRAIPTHRQWEGRAMGVSRGTRRDLAVREQKLPVGPVLTTGGGHGNTPYNV